MNEEFENWELQERFRLTRHEGMPRWIRFTMFLVAACVLAGAVAIFARIDVKSDCASYCAPYMGTIGHPDPLTAEMVCHCDWTKVRGLPSKEGE